MRAHPTANEKAFYQANGFVAVPEFLSPEELEIWRRTVDDATTARGEQTFSFPETYDDLYADRDPEVMSYIAGVYTQRVNLWQTDESMRALLFQPDLGTFVGEVAGVEGLRIWHDQALVKEPYGNPTGFHLDIQYWSFTSADAITIWIALDDATLENGCLYYVPGSHLAKKFDYADIGKNLGAIFDVYPEWRDVAAVPCPINAGGALLHNGLTIHGAGANMTPRRRRAMTCQYMPDGATFNGQQNVLPPSYFKSLAVGDALVNEQQNPLVYRRI